MSVLKRAKKVNYGGNRWELVRLGPSQEDLLKVLGILPRPDSPPKRKRGRSRKINV
jgi:hypothetical protein